MNKTLNSKAMIMLMELNSARRERRVVKEPGPAMKGKTTGMMPAIPSGSFSRKRLMSKVISMARTKMTSEPATAKEERSTPKRVRICSPRKRKARKMQRAKREVRKGLIWIPFLRRSMRTGVRPTMSMTAKSTTKALRVSAQLSCRDMVSLA